MSLLPLTRSGWANMRSLVRSINTAATSSTHVPVMLPQVLEFLKPKSGAVYCDATYGDGGYTRAILGKFCVLRSFVATQTSVR